MKRPSLVVSCLAACGALSGVVAGCSSGGPAGEPTAPPVPYEVSVTLDPGARYQVMQGFGGALAFYVNWLTDHPHRDEIYKLVFADLGLQVLRIANWYQNSSPRSFTDSVAAVAGARASLGHDPLVLLSSWSPPAAQKSNGRTRNGGSLIKDADGAYRYADFGQWWADSVAAYAAAGVVTSFVSIQNEPDFVASGWESCLFDATENAVNAGYDRALVAVADAVDVAGITPRPAYIGPESAGIANRRVESYVVGMQASGAIDRLGGIAHHLYSGGDATYPSSFNTGMAALADMGAASGKPLMMTEYGVAANLLAAAWLIDNAVTVEGVSAYYVWSLTWAPPAAGAAPGGLVTTENPGTPSTWKNPSGYAVNDSYYAVRHFAKWIDVGWQRVGAASDAAVVKLSAFASPDGQRVTLVLLNTDDDPHAVTIGMGDGASLPFATTAIYRTSGSDERTAEVGPLAGGNQVVMPAGALATVTLAP